MLLSVDIYGADEPGDALSMPTAVTSLRPSSGCHETWATASPTYTIARGSTSSMPSPVRSVSCGVDHRVHGSSEISSVRPVETERPRDSSDRANVHDVLRRRGFREHRHEEPIVPGPSTSARSSMEVSTPLSEGVAAGSTSPSASSRSPESVQSGDWHRQLLASAPGIHRDTTSNRNQTCWLFLKHRRQVPQPNRCHQ